MSDFPDKATLLAWAKDSGYTLQSDGWYDEDGQGPYALLDQWTAAMEESGALDYITGVGPLDGALQISIERTRQKAVKGWTAEHDDEHVGWDLTRAAKCYADAADYTSATGKVMRPVPENWPWDVSFWKPSLDPVLNLVKAGALIAAEIDRLERARR